MVDSNLHPRLRCKTDAAFTAKKTYIEATSAAKHFALLEKKHVKRYSAVSLRLAPQHCREHEKCKRII